MAINSTMLEVYNSNMENAEVEEIVHLKSIKVVESKTNTVEVFLQKFYYWVRWG